MPADDAVPDPPAQRGQFTSTRGVTLQTLSFIPAHTKYVLVLLHGFTDHCSRHAPVLLPLTHQGCALMAFDMVGHGLSGPPALRSYIRHFNDLVTDLIDFVELVVKKQFPSLPIFAMGHSMGGCVCALGVCRRPALFSGLILSSPMVQIQPPSLSSTVKEAVVSTLNWVPGMTYMRVVKRRPIELGMRDAAAIQEMKADTLWDPLPYYLGSVCSLLGACRMLQAEAPKGLLSVPLYIQQGDQDIATLPGPLREFVHKLRRLRGSKPAAADGSPAPSSPPLPLAPPLPPRPVHDDGSGIIYHEVEGGFHDLNHDPATPDCLRRLAAWLQQRAA